jgi:hypothetical protein
MIFVLEDKDKYLKNEIKTKIGTIFTTKMMITKIMNPNKSNREK